MIIVPIDPPSEVVERRCYAVLAPNCSLYQFVFGSQTLCQIEQQTTLSNTLENLKKGVCCIFKVRIKTCICIMFYMNLCRNHVIGTVAEKENNDNERERNIFQSSPPMITHSYSISTSPFLYRDPWFVSWHDTIWQPKPKQGTELGNLTSRI